MRPLRLVSYPYLYTTINVKVEWIMLPPNTVWTGCNAYLRKPIVNLKFERCSMNSKHYISKKCQKMSSTEPTIFSLRWNSDVYFPKNIDWWSVDVSDGELFCQAQQPNHHTSRARKYRQSSSDSIPDVANKVGQPPSRSAMLLTHTQKELSVFFNQLAATSFNCRHPIYEFRRCHSKRIPSSSALRGLLAPDFWR